MEQRLKKLRIFLNFYFSSWGAEKGARWEWFANDVPLTDNHAHRIALDILNGSDDWLSWDALEGVT